MSSNLKLALLGCGEIARFHLAGMREQAPRIDVTAAIDIDAERANAIAEQTGARAFATLDDALVGGTTGELTISSRGGARRNTAQGRPRGLAGGTPHRARHLPIGPNRRVGVRLRLNGRYAVRHDPPGSAVRQGDAQPTVAGLQDGDFGARRQQMGKSQPSARAVGRTQRRAIDHHHAFGRRALG